MAKADVEGMEWKLSTGGMCHGNGSTLLPRCLKKIRKFIAKIVGAGNAANIGGTGDAGDTGNTELR